MECCITCILINSVNPVDLVLFCSPMASIIKDVDLIETNEYKQNDLCMPLVSQHVNN